MQEKSEALDIIKHALETTIHTLETKIHTLETCHANRDNNSNGGNILLNRVTKRSKSSGSVKKDYSLTLGKDLI